jgi:hypothetical protein
MFRSYLTALLLALSPTAAFACLNDDSTVHAEREFKSSYIDRKPAPSSAQPPSTGHGPLLVYSLSGVGVVLLIGAGALTLSLSKQPKTGA